MKKEKELYKTSYFKWKAKALHIIFFIPFFQAFFIMLKWTITALEIFFLCISLTFKNWARRIVFWHMIFFFFAAKAVILKTKGRSYFSIQFFRVILNYKLISDVYFWCLSFTKEHRVWSTRRFVRPFRVGEGERKVGHVPRKPAEHWRLS